MKLSPADKPGPDKSIAIQTALRSLALCWKTLHSLLLGNSWLLQFCSSIYSKLWQLGCAVLFLRVWVWKRCVFFCTPPSSLSYRRSENKYLTEIGKTFHPAQEMNLYPSINKSNLYARVLEAVPGKGATWGWIYVVMSRLALFFFFFFDTIL